MINHPRIKLIALLAGIFVFGNASPQETLSESSCDSIDTRIYFANGVNNDRVKARISTRAIETQVRKIGFDQKFYFNETYNPSTSFAGDLLEVYLQIASDLELPALTSTQISALNELGDTTLVNISRKVSVLAEFTSSPNSGYVEAIVSGDILALQRAAIKAYSNTLSRNVERDILNTNTTIVQRLGEKLVTGDRVVVVAHSQGNLFAISAIETLLRDHPEYASSIGIVGVATPANRTLNSGVYHTTADDAVINALRTALLVSNSDYEVLPPNWRGPMGLFGAERDFPNHSFVESYMCILCQTEEVITSDIHHLAMSLDLPEPGSGDGALRATVSLTDRAEVELHVIEPDGQLVYYLNPVGNAGKMDDVNVNGLDASSYYVGCESVIEGTYKIGVNYREASKPAVATVQVSLSDGQSYSRKIDLPTNHQVGGDENPLIIFEVRVTRGINGRLLFDVDMT